MSLDTVKSPYTANKEHALSILFANRPWLLRRFYGRRLRHDLTSSDQPIQMFGEFLMGETKVLLLGKTIDELPVVDLECLAMAIDALITGVD